MRKKQKSIPVVISDFVGILNLKSQPGDLRGPSGVSPGGTGDEGGVYYSKVGSGW